jgi:alanine racemase
MTARLDVDLDAFDANLAALRARVAPAELMLVVKDDAYGHGIARIVPRAVAGGTRWIGAFDIPTARAVRAVAGPEPRIFVWMLPDAADVQAAIDIDLDIGVGDADLLEEVARTPRRPAPVPVHLKIDTGLHRNGFRPEDWAAAVARARVLEQEGLIRVVGVWSHIAEASDAEDDAAREAFERAVSEASAAGLTPRWRHLSASSASFLRPEFRYDLVRIGAFTYGVSPAAGPTADELGLRPVGTLVATVIAAGERVRVSVGAFDGLPSVLGGTFSVHTPDGMRRVERVGLREAEIEPWDGARTGEEIVIYGPSPAQSATQLAEAIGTIGEEIVTRLSPRVPRRSVGGA